MYEDDLDDEEFEERPRRPRIMVWEIDEELKAEYVALIADGLDPGSAATALGSTGSQFRKFRSPASQWYDPAFADQVAAAIASDARKINRLERLEEAFWRAVEQGEKWAVEKGLYAYHPDFEHLRHTNLRVSGEIMIAAKQLLPHLSEDEIRARLAAIEQQERVSGGKPIAELPPPQAA